MANIYDNKGITLDHTKVNAPNDKSYVLHVHNDYEMLCYVSGKVKYLVEGQEYSMYPGCLMLMRPAETHKLIVTGKGEYERYVLNFHADALRSIGMSDSILTAFTNRDLGEKNQYLSTEFTGIQPLDFFRQIEAQCHTIDPGQSMLSNLAALLCAVNTAFYAKDSRETVSEDDNIGKKLISYVNDNLTGELSLEGVSEYIHMSPSQVNRTFRKLTGTSVYDYVLSKRLIMVQELIALGEGAIAASQKCGFKDYSSFYRLYKKRTGSAPGDAKKR